MGIDIGWKILQGAPLEVWEEALGENEEVIEGYEGDLVWFLEEELGVTSVSPYYDADRSDCIYGVDLVEGDYPKEINLQEIADKAISVALELQAKYGIETNTICSQNVW